mgnify:CR=1 FL=1
MILWLMPPDTHTARLCSFSAGARGPRAGELAPASTATMIGGGKQRDVGGQSIQRFERQMISVRVCQQDRIELSVVQ